MSTIAISFTAIGVGTGGLVDIGFNDNSMAIPLVLTSKNGASVSGFFSQIPTDLPTDPDTAQAQAYAASFNRDFKNVGGTNNLSAVSAGNVVTITAVVGTFDSFAQTGNFSTNQGINNTTQYNDLVFSVVQNGVVGDCTDISYVATCSEGLGPYDLKNGTSDLITGWDGTAFIFTLKRNKISNINVVDANSLTDSVSVVTPRKLAEGDFSMTYTAYELSSDIVVERDIVIANTTPLEYSLDVIAELTGTGYQTSNAFQGVSPGQYKVFIKDKFGCEISKIIDVTTFQDATATENPRYFDIAEGQSFIFSECPDFDLNTKKNYFNTRSYDQSDLVLYPAKHFLDKDDTVKGIQFKSSYDFHTITMHKCDGTKLDVASIRIQENLGVVEKMDCSFFDVGGKTGVYFQGGNTYVPDTTTVLGTNQFFGTTPRWASVGQLVFFDGFGGFTIESSGFDSDRGGYFVVNMTNPTDPNGKVQLTYNRHDYNLFEFFVDVNDIDNKAFIVVEKGFDEQGVVGYPWIGETIEKVEDSSKMLKIDWSDTLNKGDIVFQSGITFMARVLGEFTPFWDNVAETESGDSNENSISQKTKIGFEVLIEAINTKQVTQLNVASGLDGFKVNNLLLVRQKAPKIKRLDKSNLWTWKCSFGYGGNKLAIKEDEIVFSPSTGVEGGGSTGKNPITDLSGITLLKDQLGNLVKIDGNLIKA